MSPAPTKTSGGLLVTLASGVRYRLSGLAASRQVATTRTATTIEIAARAKLLA